jgi:prolyl 4-hydroxylase
MKKKHLIIVLIALILLIILIILSIFFKRKNNVAAIDIDDYHIEEISNFLSKYECEYIIQSSKDKLFQSQIFGKGDNITDKIIDTNARNSKQCWLKDSDEIIKTISQRIANHINMDISLQEEMQVVKYDINGFYRQHYDACDITQGDFSQIDKGRGPRYITFIIYLNDEFEGGETFFPKINKKIIPKTGKAAIFYNVDKDGLRLDKSLHTGMDVINGEKWIANKWIHKGN